MIYLDYQSTTPIDKRVSAKMLEFMDYNGHFANPASQHPMGKIAYNAIEQARMQVANLIHANPREIIWTSGATESINLALKGAALFYQRTGKHIITLQTEHKAVLNCCEALEQQGFEITYLKPQTNGLIDLDEMRKAIQKNTILISVMHVNNEIGVIQDIANIGKIARAHHILFHVDAAQSVGKIPIDVRAMHIDFLSLSAHKMYGPKGVGALFISRDPIRLHLQPLIHGGGQERGLRSGTLPTHQIVGLGEAAFIAKNEMLDEYSRIQKLQQLFLKQLNSISDTCIHGDLKQRVPHNLCISFLQVDREQLLTTLMTKLAISTQSACTSIHSEISYVLSALSIDKKIAEHAIRFSFGRFTTEQEIFSATNFICDTIKQLRGELI